MTIQMWSTPAGARAYKLLDDAFADPASAVGALARLNELAAVTTDPQGLREVQDAGSMLARLQPPRQETVTRGLGWPDAELALLPDGVTRFDPRERRDFHGRWAKGGGAAAPLPGAGKAEHPMRDLNMIGMGSSGFGGPGWEDYAVPRPGGWTPDLTPAQGVKALTSRGRSAGDGTPGDPIDVHGDVHKALDLMRAGKNVRLNQPSEVALLLDEVAKISKATADLPKDQKPDWDFGLLTVRGTNLFTAQNKGIPRIDMPQFGGIAEPDSEAAKRAGGPGKFIDLSDDVAVELRALGVKVTDKQVLVTHLRATQTQLTGSKVAGFAGAVMAKVPKAVAAMKEPIYVTRDGYVVDGHHRWATNMMLDSLDGVLGNDTYQNVHEIDMDIGAMIPWALDFGKRKGLPQVGNIRRALDWAAAQRSFWNPRKHPRDTGGEFAAAPGGDLRLQPAPGAGPGNLMEARQADNARRAAAIRKLVGLADIKFGSQARQQGGTYQQFRGVEFPTVTVLKVAADAMERGEYGAALPQLRQASKDVRGLTRDRVGTAVFDGKRMNLVDHMQQVIDDNIAHLEQVAGHLPDYAKIAGMEKAAGITRGLDWDEAERAFWNPREHPRDPEGKWIQLWHGTTHEAAGQISKSGLHSASYDALPGGMGGISPNLTPDQREAFMSAHGAHVPVGGRAAVVDVRIPAEKEGEYLYPAQGHMGYRALRKPLPPSMIHGVVREHDAGQAGQRTRTGDLEHVAAIQSLPKPADSPYVQGGLTGSAEYLKHGVYHDAAGMLQNARDRLAEEGPTAGESAGEHAARLAEMDRHLAYIRKLEQGAGMSRFDPRQPRDAHGRWGHGGVKALDKTYNEIPETRGQDRGHGAMPGSGRDAADAAKLGPHQVAPPITAGEARGDSRPVSAAEFQHLAATGLNQLAVMSTRRAPLTGLDRNWQKIKDDSWAEVTQPWGGATIDAHTGKALPQGADRYALTVKPHGLDKVSVPEHATRAEFDQAMEKARMRFRKELEKGQRHLGIFHDDDHHRIDIDPVVVVDTIGEVETIGAYTHAIGGAYHFKSGDGFWPPHVAGQAAAA